MVLNQTSFLLDHSLSKINKKPGRYPYLNDSGFETKGCSQAHGEQKILKIEQKSQSRKLQPLDVSKEFEKKSGPCSKGKFFARLNPPNQFVNAVNTRKNLPSKIPVLQRPFVSKNDNSLWETSLSAADKRQKFHQSRFYVAPPCKDIHSNLQLQHEIAVFKDNRTTHDANHVSKMFGLQHSAASKVVLPPIKNSMCALKENVPQPKKKCLLGEITHFPALCYMSSKPLRIFHSNSVMQLPPIVSLPVAPPPSISTSLEHDSTKTN